MPKMPKESPVRAPNCSFNAANCDEADRAKWLAVVVDFLQEIGQPVEHVADAELHGSFLPGIKIDAGVLKYSDSAFPGDLLHEAGHLSTMPAQFRELASGGLKVVMAAMCEYVDQNPMGLMQWPEDPICRAALQCGDAEATAWQYAAGEHIGLPQEWLFPEGSYAPEGPEHVLARLKASAYFGINGLQAAGWTLVYANKYKAHIPQYPKLAFWRHP